MAGTEENEEHCSFLFYISWFCWSSNFTFQIVLFSVDTKVYCTAMENILFITNKGQDSLFKIKNTLVKVTWLLLLLLLAIVRKCSFTAASLHI